MTNAGVYIYICVCALYVLLDGNASVLVGTSFQHFTPQHEEHQSAACWTLKS